MRSLNKIIIHAAATKPTMDIGVEEIRSWHLQRGWSDIGYHYVVRKDGSIEQGRPIDRVGSHVKGQNTGSIGVCWVGGYGGVDDRNEAQKESLIRLIKALQVSFGQMSLHGHNEYSSKTCPNFNVIEEYKDLTL